MAISFPSGPVQGQSFTVGNITWTWNGSAWDANTPSSLTSLSVTNPITGSITGNAATVTNGVYTTDTGTVTNAMLAGSIANSKLANSTITVNGTSIALGASGSLSIDAGTLTGTTLNSTVVTSSLTSVGTLNGLTVGGSIIRSGNVSQAAWGTAGVGLKIPAATYTDTSSTTTLATSNVHLIGQPTLAFSSATTVGQANTVYISGQPLAGTNATVSAAYALNVASGVTNFGGAVKFNGALQSGGGASILTLSNSSATVNADLIVVGQVYQANRIAFRVTGTGGQISSPTTVTSTSWTQDFQQGTALVGSTGTFTAPVAGIYQINLVARTFSNTGGAAQAVIYKNDTIPMIMLEWAANTTANHIGGSTAAKLAVGDTLKFKVPMGSISFDVNDNWSVAFLG